MQRKQRPSFATRALRSFGVMERIFVQLPSLWFPSWQTEQRLEFDCLGLGSVLDLGLCSVFRRGLLPVLLAAKNTLAGAWAV